MIMCVFFFTTPTPTALSLNEYLGLLFFKLFFFVWYKIFLYSHQHSKERLCKLICQFLHTCARMRTSFHLSEKSLFFQKQINNYGSGVTRNRDGKQTKLICCTKYVCYGLYCSLFPKKGKSILFLLKSDCFYRIFQLYFINKQTKPKMQTGITTALPDRWDSRAFSSVRLLLGSAHEYMLARNNSVSFSLISHTMTLVYGRDEDFTSNFLLWVRFLYEELPESLLCWFLLEQKVVRK